VFRKFGESKLNNIPI